MFFFFFFPAPCVGPGNGKVSFLEKEKLAPMKDGLLPALPEVIIAKLGAFAFLRIVEALLRFSPVLEYSFPSDDFPHLSGISWKGALVRQV